MLVLGLSYLTERFGGFWHWPSLSDDSRSAGPNGTLVDEATWWTKRDGWLQSAQRDTVRAFVESLMHPVTERGIHDWSLDCRYVEFR